MSASIIPDEKIASDFGGEGREKREPGPPPRRRRLAAQKALIALLIVVGVTLLSAATWTLVADLSETRHPLVLHKVTAGDLPIIVKERGNLESQQKTLIRCEVDSYERSGGSGGTRIIHIVPNGSAVKEGELLVELDSAPLSELLNTQELATEKARAQMIQSRAKYENQMTQNETALKEAELTVELAELELKMYTDEDGTLEIALQELRLKIEEAQNQILEAQAAMEMQKIELDGIELLNRLGYRGQGDLRQASRSYLTAQGTLVKATNQLLNARSNLKKLKEYEGEMQVKTLGGALETARRAMIQVQRDNESLLAQALAAKTASERSLTKEEERLKKYQTQLKKCKIYAPHDGMAVYAAERRSSTMIQEGAEVRMRQSILSLPNLSTMQVKTAVHESVLDQVNSGLQVTIRIDALPHHTYQGEVDTVGVLPDQSRWSSSDIKVYETIVKINDKVDQLRPGMTAEVEIHVDRLTNVLSIPVQAIVQVGQESWCYVQDGDGPVRRDLKLGRTNDKFVEVVAGLQRGDQVVLNPMAITGDEPEPGAGENEPEQGADPEPATEQAAASPLHACSLTS